MTQELEEGRIGLLLTPSTGYRLDGIAIWAMDNGAFTNKYPGDNAYLRFLNKNESHQERCLFVAAPDVVGDSQATLEMFTPIARRIKEAGWPVALVAQDGMTEHTVPWDNLDWLFIGGTTEWKLSQSVANLIVTAKQLGKKVHVGRVNSRKRFRHFAELECDSADGTTIAFAPARNLPVVLGWIADDVQLSLPTVVA